ncbi:hypothetical protein G7K_3369-t1 [Saitoella complicata NRRL Y-17804]|uniref:Uncharacterized protein n=1 Tax=Saitoella complicata (strain BCRC 22490 / CBS 7301 / JCM 7358 / NBRC 10748 / NRRL Y-17804) TaxID=698492 RepID=A0A0E9NHN7_SAICN|nr:hypothetical protein G7K_3369-t1 [Saitoella complicata NRRL Y-17804]
MILVPRYRLYLWAILAESRLFHLASPVTASSCTTKHECNESNKPKSGGRDLDSILEAVIRSIQLEGDIKLSNAATLQKQQIWLPAFSSLI